MYVAGIVSPKKSIKVKYCSNVKGGFTASTFKDYRLPTSIVTALVGASNKLLALNTWTNYKTAENQLMKCESLTGVKMRFPMTNREDVYMQILIIINPLIKFNDKLKILVGSVKAIFSRSKTTPTHTKR